MYTGGRTRRGFSGFKGLGWLVVVLMLGMAVMPTAAAAATGDVQIEHRLAGTCLRDCPWYLAETVGVEAAQVGEAPVLLRRVRQRQLPVARECFRLHGARTSGAASVRSRRDP